MQILLLCRHGATADPEGQRDLPLSEQGKKEIENLARKVESVARRLALTIWSSTSKRGRDSTDILVKLLGDMIVQVEYFEEFWVDNNHPYKEEWIAEKISAFKGNALLIMSHAPIAEYPVSFGGDYFPLKTGDCLMVRGEGWTIKI